ncbi:GGDEF domain-containing protein [Noviherbaspirillum humi]|uniref:GGDEF domain-containing protein n=1 Tax=Noviherbaspirillum humi TaxID=1688639 RepID=UPI001594EA7B|nr:GGDEF domain-containing protein [Noviherbaspirillum humi]
MGRRAHSALLARVVPVGTDLHSEAGEEFAKLLNLAVLAALVIPVFVVEFVWFRRWDLAILLSLAGTVMVGAPWIARRTANIGLARELFLISLFSFKLYESLLIGSVFSPGSMWFITMPVVGILFGSMVSASCWLAMGVGALVALHGWFRAHPVSAPALAAHAEFMYTYSLVFMGLAIAAFVFMMEVARKRAWVRLQQANATVKELAERDPLTGLYNRRHVWSELEQEERRAGAERSSFFVFLLDIDHFKTINDTHGHAVGDAVLQRVASALGNEIRGTDCFGRYGGEEFILLFKSANGLHPERFAERLRQCVASLSFVSVEGPRKVTVSIGIAEFSPGESFSKTISRADQALYVAKASGRNRVIRAFPAEESDGDAIRTACVRQAA